MTHRENLSNYFFLRLPVISIDPILGDQCLERNGINMLDDTLVYSLINQSFVLVTLVNNE